MDQLETHETDREFQQVDDLSMVVEREPEADALSRIPAIEEVISTLPTGAVDVTRFELNRRFIIYILLVTVCAATFVSLIAVLFFKSSSDAAVAVLAPLMTLATAVVFFYFPRGAGA